MYFCVAVLCEKHCSERSTEEEYVMTALEDGPRCEYQSKSPVSKQMKVRMGA